MIRAFILSITLLLILCPKVALAWERPTYEDATVVERSELIVVAHLKEGSILKVSHEKSPVAGASWEYHATLVISTVLKGKCDKQEIPLIIHYGLSPLDGGGEKDSPKNGIRILDTSGGSEKLDLLVKDAGGDNLWFLRKRSGIYGREAGTGNYGIVDPEDLQPLESKPCFLCYLSDNPEASVKEYIRKNPDMAERGKRYLDHLEVQRILKTEDLGKRYDALLPFFLNRTTWDMKEEAGVGIATCGKAAGERLKDVFTDPTHHNLRSQIIRLWRNMGYRPIAPFLIDLLIQHDRFWAGQDLKKGWWSDESDPELTRRRQDIYGEVYGAVYTLRSFCDPKAKDVLEITRKRWIAVDFDNKQIVEECEAALRELAAKEGAAKPAAP
jgi:hypothetical protein